MPTAEGSAQFASGMVTTSCEVAITDPPPSVSIDSFEAVATSPTSIRIDWTSTGCSAMYYGRNAGTVPGQVAWESPSPKGPDDGHTFATVLSGSTYVVHIEPVVDGVRRPDLRETRSVTTPTVPSSGPPYIVGISRTTQGLNGSESHKQAATRERYDQFAAALGITGAQMRALGGRHVYYTGSTLPTNLTSIGVVQNCADDGYGNCMFTASRLGDRPGRAMGNWNQSIKNLLATKHNTPGSVLDQMILMVNFDHEPSNDQDPWTKSQWRQIQAQMAKAIWEMNDPTVWYTTCHIPSAVDSTWTHMAELQSISPANWAAIDARTYNGLDPYPEGEAGPPISYGTAWARVDQAVNAIRNAGHTGPLSFPEVALFHYDDTGSNQGPLPLSPAGQAQRLHDNFCVEMQAEDDLRAMWYFDVTDVNNPRGDTRILQTPEEQLEYARIIRRDPGHFAG